MARISLEGYPSDYIEQCGSSDISITMTEAVQKMQWGTLKDGKEPVQLVWKRLVDLSTDHLKNILKTQKLKMDGEIRKVIVYILSRRGAVI